MSLARLPGEILVEIFSIVAGPQPTSAEACKTLANASLACRRVSVYSQSALFKNVSLEVYQPILKPEWAEESDGVGIPLNEEYGRQLNTSDDAKYEREFARLEAYVRACGSNHTLRDAARSLEVQWVMDLNSDFVHRLSILESLMSNISSAADIHVEIFNHWRGPKEPPTHMYQRNPRDFMGRVCKIDIQRDDSEFDSERSDCQVHTTRVKCRSRPIRLEILESILSSNLGPIELTIPLIGESAVVNRKFTRLTSRRAFDLQEELSPVQIQRRCLDKIRGNLIDLNMYGNGIKLTGGHDDSRLDLRSFGALTHVNVDGALLFGNSPSTADVMDKDLPSRLPPNLQSLTIQFPRDQGVFWSLPIARKLKYRPVNEIINRALVSSKGGAAPSCIQQLLEHKQSHLPNLENLGLYENEVVGPWVDYKIVSWPLPEWLRQCADDYEVEVEVNIRVSNLTRLLPAWEIVMSQDVDVDRGDVALDTDHELDEYY